MRVSYLKRMAERLIRTAMVLIEVGPSWTFEGKNEFEPDLKKNPFSLNLKLRPVSNLFCR